MGIEYQGKFNISPLSEVIPQLLDQIAELPGLTQIEGKVSQPNSLLLRFTEYQERNEWPEDMVVMLNEGICYVLFHVSPPHSREAIISTIETILAQAGYPCDLEEL